MMWDDGGWGVGGWIATSVMMLVFWGGLIALVVLIVRASLGDQARDGTTRGQDADEVLAERFARGEIDEDEFARRREVLHSGMNHSSQ
jgi:putative membrane protein